MGEVTSRSYGVTAAPPNRPGTPVTEFTVTAGDFTLRLLDLGARVVDLTMPDRHGSIGPVCLSLPSLAAYEDPDVNKHMGDTIGRYANRIGGATITIDGETFPLTANDGANQLHGGPGGFGRRVWRGEPFTVAGGAGVRFTYESPHLEEGFPGTLTATSRTMLTADGTLRFGFSATTDRPTVAGFTNHAYWNLAGTGTPDDHLITINASRYLPVDSTGIPLPEGPAAVDGTSLDLRTERSLASIRQARSERGETGIDHCYLPEATPGISMPQAIVRHIASGRRMELWSDQPGLQCYTAHHLAETGYFPAFGAVCLEAQQLPDSPNRPDFPSPILRPGDTYTATTVLRFSVAAD